MKAFEHINTEPVYIDEPVLYLLQPLSSNYYHAVIEATVRLVVRAVRRNNERRNRTMHGFEDWAVRE